jgi:putative transposase
LSSSDDVAGLTATMLRTFQFRMQPNHRQRQGLEFILADNCETYNAAFEERRDAWRLERKSVTYRMQQDELTQLRRQAVFRLIACDIQRDPLRRVNLAFQAFFRRLKAALKKQPPREGEAQESGFPRFRSVQRYDSFTFSLPRVEGRHLRIPKLGLVKMRGGRPVSGRAKVCTVKREGRRWTANIVCDIGPAPDPVPVTTSIGIDVGIQSLATLSNGETIANPRWAKEARGQNRGRQPQPGPQAERLQEPKPRPGNSASDAPARRQRAQKLYPPRLQVAGAEIRTGRP